jgi:hypothetical protein
MQKSIILLILWGTLVSCYTTNTSFLNMFDNQLKKTIQSYGGLNFNLLSGFGTFTDDWTTTYYATDYSGQRLISFDENWEYKAYFGLDFVPVNLKQIGSFIYVTTNGGIYKLNKCLKVVNYTENFLYNNGLSYNEQNETILVSDERFGQINKYDKNLVLKDSIDTSNNRSSSIQFSNGKYYVGTLYGKVLVIQSDKVIKSFSTKCEMYITSIIIDKFGNLAILCWEKNMIYIYNSDGIYLDKSIQVPTKSIYMEIDAKGRLVIVGRTQISLYY